MPSATVTSKGQITIPQEVRERLQLKMGDRVDFLINDDGRVLMQPALLPVTALKGLLRRAGGKKVSVDEMNAAIRARFGKKA
jgi:AbrB family looped-hinge helix DNA binding protein